MIPTDHLRELARARLRDAVVLYRGGRIDAAEYICGYAVELALKARICRTNGWEAYPETVAEFKDLASFKTHILTVLLRISGIEPRILRKHGWAWIEIMDWDPKLRYRSIGAARYEKVRMRLAVTRHLLKVI